MTPLLSTILAVFLTQETPTETKIAEMPQALCSEVLEYVVLDAVCVMQIEPTIRPKRNPIYEN